MKIKNAIVTCVAWIGITIAAPAVWDGTADVSWFETNAQTYNLTTAEQLAGLAKLVNDGISNFQGKTITLGADIFLNDTTGAGDGSWYKKAHREWTPIGTIFKPFKGEIDALAGKKNRKIYGLYISDETMNFAGLFGYTENLKISNLDVSVGYVAAKEHVGSVLGYGHDALISNVYAEIEVSGTNYVGGLVGYLRGDIFSSSVKGNVVAQDTVGGIVGYSKGRIDAVNHIGDIRGASYVGGVVGYAENIKDSYHKGGDVIGTADFVGGLAGYCLSTSQSYAEGIVNGSLNYVGGVVGKGNSVDSTYHVGNVKGCAYVGGVVGYVENVKDSYHRDGEVAGAGNYVGGVAGFSSSIYDSFAEGSVKSDSSYVGGVVGYSKDVLNAAYHINGEVNGYAYVGGVAGYANQLASSHSEGYVIGKNNFVGGVSGYVVGTVDSVYHKGDCVMGMAYVGGLAGLALAPVTNSYSEGNVIGSGNYVGGLLGQTSDSVANVHSLGNVESRGNCVGGLIGLSYFFYNNWRKNISVHSVEKSYAVGNVSGWNNVGGLVGLDSIFNGDSSKIKDTVTTSSIITRIIHNSYSEGNVNGTGNYVGGILGKSSFRYGVKNSSLLLMSVFHHKGDVNGDAFIGGLAGLLTGTITDSRSEGNVVGKGSHVGGLAGLMRHSLELYGSSYKIDSIDVIRNSYAVGSVYGKSDVGGLSGSDCIYRDSLNHYGLILYGVERKIYGSHFKGSVVGTSDYVGGLLGRSYYSDENIYSMRIDSSFFEGGDVFGEKYVGGLVGQMSGNIINSHSKGNVKGNDDYVGGVAGHASDIVDSYSEGNIRGNGFVGGVVGLLSGRRGNLRRVHFVGNVFGLGDYVGGVAGQSTTQDDFNYIDSSYHIGGDVRGNSYVGGIAGQTAHLKNSYSEGNVKGTGDYVGGLIGSSERVGKSYSIGKVDGSGSYIGGLAGNISLLLASSFHKGGNVAGNSFVGGLAGYAYVVEDSWSEGNVSGTKHNVGGVVGNALQVFRSYHINGDVAGVNNVGGVVGGSGGYLDSSYSIGNVLGADSVGGLAGGCRGSIHDSYAVANSVRGTDYVGGLAGCGRSRIVGSFFWGDSVIGASHVGGFVGVLNGEIDSSYSTAHVKGDDNVGGLVGSAYGSISNTYALGNVVGDVNHSSAGNDNLGGLVGYVYKGSISKSLAKGNVSGTTKLGGLVGRFDGDSISQSYANGNVIGNYYGDPADEVGNFYIGGFVGYAKGSVSESYAAGLVSGMENTPVYTGCLIGYVDGSLIVNDTYYDNEKCSLEIEGKRGVNTAGATFANSSGKTTSAMQQEMTFVNWDFVDTWSILEDSYPFLHFFENSFANADVTTESLKGIVYDGKAKTPAVTKVELGGSALTENNDYQVSYQNNIDAGTASIKICGLGVYSGCKIIPFTIAPISLKITLGKIENQVYDTFEKTPTVSIYEGETLVDDKSFSIEYANNINAGIASVKVSLFGNYSGSASTTFTIEKAKSIIEELPTARGIFYGQTLEKSRLEGGSANIEGTFGWSKTDITPDPVNDGYEVTFVPKDTANYLSSTRMVSLIVKKCVVSFTYEESVLQLDSLMYGETPQYKSDIPKRTSVQYEYVFKKWSPEISPITGNQTYVAIFDSTLRKYTISFYSGDSLLQSSEFEYGKKPAVKSNPQKEKSDQYVYHFKDWSPAIVSVTEDVKYYAVFDSSTRYYSVKFMNGKDVLQNGSVAYGETPKYTGKTPTKKSTNGYSFKFTGWSPKLGPITKESEFVAVFDSTKVTGIHNVRLASSNMSVNAVSRSIQISAAPIGKAFALFDMQGRILEKSLVESANFNVSVPRAGSYFIRIDNQVRKVNVR